MPGSLKIQDALCLGVSSWPEPAEGAGITPRGAPRAPGELTAGSAGCHPLQQPTPSQGTGPSCRELSPSPDRGQAAGGAQRGLQPCSRLPVCTREPHQDHSGRQVTSSERGRGRCSPVLSIAFLVPATWRPAQVWSASDHVITVNTAGHHSTPKSGPKAPCSHTNESTDFHH